jgi:hypothetical protein
MGQKSEQQDMRKKIEKINQNCPFAMQCNVCIMGRLNVFYPKGTNY